MFHVKNLPLQSKQDILVLQKEIFLAGARYCVCCILHYRQRWLMKFCAIPHFSILPHSLIPSHFTGEREKRKDQLLELQKSKQERTDSELKNMRQVCSTNVVCCVGRVEIQVDVLVYYRSIRIVYSLTFRALALGQRNRQQ